MNNNLIITVKNLVKQKKLEQELKEQQSIAIQQNAIERSNILAVQEFFFDGLRCMNEPYRLSLYSRASIEIEKGNTSHIARVSTTISKTERTANTEMHMERLLQKNLTNLHEIALERLRNQLYQDAQTLQASMLAYSQTWVWQGKTQAELYENYCNLYRSLYPNLFLIKIGSVKLFNNETQIKFQCAFENKYLTPSNYFYVLEMLMNGAYLP
ncbi:MAG: hypothetical protein SPE25_08515 [Lachnospiraceae bacterium]|nr:hypothetical protein [Lachnospiraceae bacterium]